MHRTLHDYQGMTARRAKCCCVGVMSHSSADGVRSENSIGPSRGSMIVAKEPAEPRPTSHGTGHAWWHEPIRRNQPIVQALVIPFLVIVRHERGERPAQVGFAEDDDLIQAFLFNGPDESLRVRITVGRLKRRLHDAEAAIGQGLTAPRAPFGIAIANEDPVALEDPVIGGGEHTRHLAHEGVVRMWGRAHEMHPAITPQCAARNVRHDRGRSGTGPIPAARSIVAIVDRATRCPRFCKAPWIRR